ncbi:MAG TPA: hypothetical protein VGR62_25055 [Candidatus Binatia bacterium]|jgi:hypothetical protein|nr:hypothetical protein [Candidatus Binatia bacterium]
MDSADRARLPYPMICVLVGIGVGWLPVLVHGPIPYKFNVLGIRGDIAVWAWYLMRLLIGLVVGISVWPRAWYVRGPLCGFLLMFPLSLVNLATPGCGGTCMFWNDVTATLIGGIVGGVAFAVTHRHHA